MSKHIILFVLPCAFAFAVAFTFHSDNNASDSVDALVSAVIDGNQDRIEAAFLETTQELQRGLEAAMADPNQTEFKRLARQKNTSIFSIVGGFCLLALLIPPTIDARAKGNALTTLAVGYIVAHFAVRFRLIDWPEFFGWGTLGFAGAFAVVLMRGYLASRKTSPQH